MHDFIAVVAVVSYNNLLAPIFELVLMRGEQQHLRALLLYVIDYTTVAHRT
jgi:Na+/H+ antiporter NhaB